MRKRLGRRGFLSVAGGMAGAAALGAPGSISLGVPLVRRSARGRARNVIFMVSDGMSTGTLTLADMLCRRVHGRPSYWVTLLNEPGVRRSLQLTHAADSLVTDSAAAGCAWGIGEHINNGVVNVTPDGRTPTPLLVHASQQGKATGLVTTTRVTHATPASFIANVPDRDMEGAIAEQMIDRGCDVVLGGGAKHFPAELVGKRPELRVARTRDELAGAGRGPLLGLFARDHMSFSLDRGATEPTLAEMTVAALARLGGRSDGFVLQIEGGRVDHGAHSNDAGGMLYDQLAFDEALAVAALFARERDDTLLVVTTDHGNANPGLSYYGAEGNLRFERLLGVRRSFEWIQQRYAAGRRGGEVDLGAIVTEATGIALDAEELEQVGRALAGGQRVDPFDLANGVEAVLGSVIANHLGVAFLSPNHTADAVEVTALGPGSEALPQMVDNVQLHQLVVEAMDLGPAEPMASSE